MVLRIRLQSHQVHITMLHFGDAPQATLLEKLNLTQQKHTFTNQKKCTTIQNKHTQKKLKPGLVASYDIHPANRGPRRYIS